MQGCAPRCPTMQIAISFLMHVERYVVSRGQTLRSWVLMLVLEPETECHDPWCAQGRMGLRHRRLHNPQELLSPASRTRCRPLHGAGRCHLPAGSSSQASLPLLSVSICWGSTCSRIASGHTGLAKQPMHLCAGCGCFPSLPHTMSPAHTHLQPSWCPAHPAALGGNLGGVTSRLLGLDGGGLAKSLKLDTIIPVQASPAPYKRCLNGSYGFGKPLLQCNAAQWEARQTACTILRVQEALVDSLAVMLP